MLEFHLKNIELVNYNNINSYDIIIFVLLVQRYILHLR